MFSVSIEQLDKKLKDWTEKINNFVNNGGKGYKLKIDFGEAESVIKTLKKLKIGDSSEIQRMQREIDGLKKKLKELNDGSGLRNVADNITKPLKRGVDESKKIADEIEKSKKRVVDAYTDMMKSVNALQMDRAHARGLGIDVSSYKQVIADMKSFASEMSRLSSNPKFLGNTGAVTSMMNQYDRYMQVIRMLRNEIEGLSRTQREQSRTAEKQKLVDKRSVNEAVYQIAVLEKKIAALQALQSQANKLGVKTPNLDKLLQDMDGYMQKFTAIFRNGGHLEDGTTAQMLKAEGGYRALTQRIQQNTQETRINIAARNSAVAAVTWLAGDEMRLAQALETSTSKLHNQSQVLSDLKTLATQYLGVWGGQQFLNNIIQIGGQLEMQRLSIGAILQNQAQANDLFNKIKGLATQSPFGVVELDQMTKQLTAYGFKYNELFDMTKRLADISAATGTGVDRLALALGHVRSEAALSGYTLRQFSMGNVPLLDKLSEKLGKSTEEIRKMVRAKQISYDDVVGVLKDLTDEGGMFHNMQEVISQSVKAKFKNVKDAMDIMYGEMAEGDIGEALKEVADVLMELTRNWKDVATVMGSVVGVWAIHRAAILTMNAALGSNTASVTANMLAYKQKRAAELQSEALTRKLTAEELELVATRKQITAANIRVALSTNAMTKGEALRLVGLRKLSLEEAKALIRSGEFTAAEVRMALQGRVLGMNLGYAGNMMRYFATSAKMAMAAFLTNPWTWAMAGITAIVELWQRNNQELERAKELNDDIYNRSQEGLKNTRLMMQNTGIRVDWRNGKNDQWDNVTGTFGQQTGGFMRFVKPSFDKNHDIEGTIEAWQQYIRDYAATPNRILNNAMTYQVSEKGEDGIEKVTTKVRELRDQYDLLYESVINVSRAQQQMQHTGDAIEFAVNETNKGWLDDDLLTSIGDYDIQVKKLTQNIGKTYGDLRKYIDDTVRKAQKEDKKFAEATKGMDNYSQAFAFLVKNHEKFSKADEIFKDAHFGVSGAYEGLLDGGLFDGGTMSGLENARKTMEEDLNQFFTSLDNQLRNQKGWHIDEVLAGKMTLSEDKQQALLSSWKDALSKVQGLTNETARDLTQKFSERYHIQIDAETENAIVKLAQLEQTLNNLVNGDYKVNVETMTNSEAVFDKLKKDYKAAKSYIETSKPILAKFGISFTGKVLSKEQIAKALSNIPDKNIRDAVAKIFEGFNQAMGQLGKTQEAANNIGLKLEDDKKQKGTGSKKTGGTKAYKDEFAKRWDERIRIMKEAYGWYEKWEKKVGETAAFEKVTEKYGDVFKEWETDKLIPLKFDAKDIKDYQIYVKLYTDAATEQYRKQKNDKSKNYGEQAQRVMRYGIGVLADMDFDKFVKAGTEFKSIIDQTIEDLNTKWDIYKSVREATGNAELALDVAGIQGGDRNQRNSADVLKADLERRFHDIGGFLDITFDKSMDEEKVRNMFKNIIPDGEKEKIDGFVEAYKEWQKLQQNVVKQDLSSYTKLLGLVTNYDAQIKKINDRLEQQKKANNALVGTKNESGTVITQEMADKANNIAETQADWEKMQLSAQYANLYNNAIAMSRTEFEQATTAVEKMIERLKELGLLSPEKAVQEQQKLQKSRNEYSTTGFLGEKGAVGQFISGGYDGLMNYYAKRRDEAQEKADKSENGSQEQKDAQKEADHYGKLFKNMSELSDAAKDVITAFSTLQSGMDLVTNLFDSMGKEGAANAVGDAAGVLGGAMQGAQSLAALGPWGMAAGAGLGLVSGLFAVHDKALQREIERLREDVQKIENNTSLILQARERTLGFDTGDLRRSYMGQYANDQNRADALQKYGFLLPSSLRQGFNSEAQRAMYEYYKTNSTGTGYQQQYQNLIKERQDYMDMYNAEQDKKKSSGEALEEYRKKIAELDDEIRYFTQDLAKQLFDIDIKGWADQLSDALSSAFENGESAAKAYKDTVTNILQQVMNKMMQVAILEPMFQNLQDKLFGNSEKNIKGVFDAGNPQKSMNAVIATITSFFGKGGDGEQTVTAALEFMNAFERGLNNAGLSVLNSDNANTLSSGVQGTSEETSALLAGYVNAARQDLSIMRILQESQYKEFVQTYWSDYIGQISGMSNHIAGIHDNTQALVRMIERGDGALFDAIKSMSDHIDRAANGIEQISIK